MEYFDVKIRVPYADVDQMGVVYYANYLVYFERGRTEFLRAIGFDYKNIEENFKLYLPVRETHVRYIAPARYDDSIVVRTWIEKMKKASIFFSYEVSHETGTVLVRGSTTHVFITDKWKPAPIPSLLSKKISPHIKKTQH